MPPPAQLARTGEWVFATLVLLWLGEVHGPLRRVLADRDIGYALLAVCAILLVRRRRELRALLAQAWPVLLPVFVAALSPAWSLDPQVSLRTALSLEAATAFGLWLALRFDAAERHLLLAVVLALGISASLLVIAVAPGIGVTREIHPGAWQGLYYHKNVFARYLSLAVLACGLLALADRRAREWATAVTLLAVALFLPARSVGGAAALLLAATFTALVVGFGRLGATARRRSALAALVVLGLAASFALPRLPALLAVFGRDMTLTRRTNIWASLVGPLLAHPWLGHGYGAFWTVAPAHREVIRSLHFDPEHAHNGLIDLALELGLVGLVAFLIPFALASARAVRLALAERNARSVFPLAFLAWFITSNLPESALVRGGRLGWAVFVAVAAGLLGERAPAAQRSGA